MNIEPELLSLKTKLTAEIESDTKEIEFLKKRVSKNETLLQAVKGSLSMITREAPAPVSLTNYGAKAATVRAAIKEIPSTTFTMDDVLAELKRQTPNLQMNRPNLRTAIWTLAKRKEIRLVKKGSNQHPAEYEKAESSLPLEIASQRNGHVSEEEET